MMSLSAVTYFPISLQALIQLPSVAQTRVYGLVQVAQKLLKPLAKIQKSFWDTVWLAASVLCLPTGFHTSMILQVSAPRPVNTCWSAVQFRHGCTTVSLGEWQGYGDRDSFRMRSQPATAVKWHVSSENCDVTVLRTIMRLCASAVEDGCSWDSSERCQIFYLPLGCYLLLNCRSQQAQRQTGWNRWLFLNKVREMGEAPAWNWLKV